MVTPVRYGPAALMILLLTGCTSSEIKIGRFAWPPQDAGWETPVVQVWRQEF